MVDTLKTLLEPWATLYSDHTALATAILAGHLLALFVGGGVAFAADRTLLRAAPASPADHLRLVDELHGTHALVIGMLAVTVLTGIAMATADVETFAGSAVYWTKMGVFVLLLGNGVLLRRAEATVRAAAAAAAPGAIPWGAVRAAAQRSMAGWCLLVLLGVLLTNG